ncbi:rolling circle replication-associated protein [Collimonas fungivorans]|uniref:Replication-associated protein ORF2/G2P domain-containing protein n=1 Tax=Collimonas fungivorans (strain Ter331) TaxID=1005048 RepID=G0AGW4_COLFT|nr:hypothetical protein [Collimonas fungivorans]AEK61969.1 hypothetical protein CFU_2139 [Collimonas fungivorans Ter331]
MPQFHSDLNESSSTFVTTPQEKPEWWTDDGNGWQDTYTARQRIFANGQTEITVTKDKFFVGRDSLPVPHAKRGASEKREANEEDAGKRAKQKVRLCCKEIGADRMVTLTYRENMIDRETALKHWKAFTRRLSKHKAFHYVAVIEEQKRGALHFHVAVSGRQDYRLLRSVWQSILGLGQSGEQMGQVNVRDPSKFGFGRNGAHKLAEYIAKYCGKLMDCRDLNQKRYFRSRGIVIPVMNSWRVCAHTMLHAVQIGFEIAREFGLAGAQTWCNNGLGVFWIATAPHDGPLIDTCPF